MESYREAIRSSPDPWRLRREMARYALRHGVRAAAREYGAGVRTVQRLVARLREGPLDGPDRRSTGRYRDLMKNSPDFWRVRRDMVAFALRHGVEPAAREFGTDVSTVRKWVRRAREGPWKTPGPVHGGGRRLSLAQVESIVLAKLEHPDFGAARLKKELGLPYGHGQMTRVLREHGLSRKLYRNDPEFIVHSAELRLGLARMHLVLSALELAQRRRRRSDFNPAATKRRIAVLEGVLRKKRAILARARERRRRKAEKGEG